MHPALPFEFVSRAADAVVKGADCDLERVGDLGCLEAECDRGHDPLEGVACFVAEVFAEVTASSSESSSRLTLIQKASGRESLLALTPV